MHGPPAVGQSIHPNGSCSLERGEEIRPGNSAQLGAGVGTEGHGVAGQSLAVGAMMAGDVTNTNAKTVQGANVALARAGSFVTVEDAVVTQPDVAATNGVVHVIDRVLVPPKKH